MIHHILSFLHKFVAAVLAAMALLFASSCSQKPDAADLDTAIDDAEVALADNDAAEAQTICNKLTTEDIDILTEEQLGRLAIIYMKLSEQINSDENVADAATCLRQAWKMSGDSLHAFSSKLPPEDLRHFVMAKRIAGSIDCPPNLIHDYEPDSASIEGAQPADAN